MSWSDLGFVAAMVTLSCAQLGRAEPAHDRASPTSTSPPPAAAGARLSAEPPLEEETGEETGEDATAPVEAAIGEPFSLAHGDEASVGDDLRLTFASVFSDSRCPEDVDCVWAGNAEIGVEVAASGEPGALLHLNTEPTMGRTATYHLYTVELLGLDPQPRTDREGQPEYVASLRVERSE